MIKMIIWDADGVLFNTFTPDGRFVWSQNIQADLGINEEILGQVFSGNWGNVLLGRMDIAEHVEKVFQRNALSLSVDAFISYWLEKDSRVNEQVAKYLTLYPSCIGSNQPLARTLKFEEWFHGRVQRVFTSSRIGALKPEATYYEYIEKELSLSPEELCLIDDTCENVDAAEQRGWRGHSFTTPYELDRFLIVENYYR